MVYYRLWKRSLSSLHGEEIAPGVYATIIRKCGDYRSLKLIHDQVSSSRYSTSTFLANLLVEKYGKLGNLDEACTVFRCIQQRNIFSWNIMVSVFVRNSQHRRALELFRYMGLEGVRPDAITFINVLGACSSVKQVIGIHTLVESSGVESDVVLGTALVNMYGRVGRADIARSFFDKMPVRNVVTWNAMIAAYAQNGHFQEAIETYEAMDMEPDEITFVNVLPACGGKRGRRIHEQIISFGLEKDIVVGTSLVTMYGRSGLIEDAYKVFSKMEKRNVVTYTAMLCVYAERGYYDEALEVYREMKRMKLKLDSIAFVSALSSCSGSNNLSVGREVHENVIAAGVKLEGELAACVVDMYGKCGTLEKAREVFDSLSSTRRGVTLWNTMLLCYAQNGHRDEVVKLLSEMVLEGAAPNGITLICVLHVFAHGGVLEEGLRCFAEFKGDYGVTPTGQHYGCLADLLARMGRLEDAQELLKVMPYEPGWASWTGLLGACRNHGDSERALQLVDEAAVEKSSTYVLLSTTLYVR